MDDKCKKLLLVGLILIPFLCQVQVAKNRWNAYRIEYIAGVGVTNFVGELGGAN